MTRANIERRGTLRQLLLERQHEIQEDVKERVRASRLTRAREVGDSLDTSDEDIQNGMDFTLLQMKTTMLSAVTQALVRLDAGRYGDCTECGDAISSARLRAIPFAVRCQSCEAERETAQRQQRGVQVPNFGADVSHMGQ